MPKKTHPPLPEPLRYLQPFVRRLGKLPPDELNEDVDPSRMESALRKRLRGMDQETAAAELTKDRDLLEGWLKDSNLTEHPAYWVLGFLMHPELAELLSRPPEAPPRGPMISFEPPEGWKIKVVPFALYLKKGKWIGEIVAIDEFTFNSLLSQLDHISARVHGLHPPGWIGSNETFDVKFGDVTGKKYLFRQVAPAPWKRVDYLLAVPSGFVSVTLDAFGADFDETLFEFKLHTLRLSEPVVHPR